MTYRSERPFVRVHRPLPPRGKACGGVSGLGSYIRTPDAEIAASERPTADDVGRILRRSPCLKLP